MQLEHLCGSCLFPVVHRSSMITAIGQAHAVPLTNFSPTQPYEYYSIGSSTTGAMAVLP